MKRNRLTYTFWPTDMEKSDNNQQFIQYGIFIRNFRFFVFVILVSCSLFKFFLFLWSLFLYSPGKWLLYGSINNIDS